MKCCVMVLLEGEVLQVAKRTDRSSSEHERYLQLLFNCGQFK